MPADTGNPNFFKIFKGFNKMTDVNANLTVDNTTVLVTAMNDVVILTNFVTNSSISSGSTLFKLPAACRPKNTTNYIVPMKSNSSYSYCTIEVGSDGVVKTRKSLSGSSSTTITLYLDGFSFNISHRWYHNVV